MNKLAYSTESGSHKKNLKDNNKKKYEKSEGPLKVRIEKKGRGGKSVTVLFNLPFDQETAKDEKKKLAQHLGTGTTFKDARIEIQGDHVDKVLAYFEKKGIKAIKAGG